MSAELFARVRVTSLGDPIIDEDVLRRISEASDEYMADNQSRLGHLRACVSAAIKAMIERDTPTPATERDARMRPCPGDVLDWGDGFHWTIESVASDLSTVCILSSNGNRYAGPTSAMWSGDTSCIAQWFTREQWEARSAEKGSGTS